MLKDCRVQAMLLMTDIADLGFVKAARFKDSEGNTFGILEPTEG